MTHCIPSTARNGQCDIAVDRHGFHIATSSHIHDHKCGPHPTQKKTKVTSGSLTTAFESSLLFLPSPPSSPLLLLSPYFCISFRFLFCSLTHSLLIPPAPHPSPSWYSSERYICVYHNSSFCCRHVGTGTPPSPAPSHTPLSQKYVHTDTTWYVSSRRGDSHQGDTVKCSSGVRLQ